ncbi:MAG: hypothetical protein U1D30_14240 [Planctomycetota bacterium]
MIITLQETFVEPMRSGEPTEGRVANLPVGRSSGRFLRVTGSLEEH